MPNIAITAENISKSYLVGHQSAQRERYTALRDVIVREARNFGRKGIDLLRGRQIVQGDEVEQFWALKDISFEVKRGEVLGIIGRNGAGKSTLLKILSRITEPTGGRVTLRGRVASLLEVGAGFHPELSGRENIFLNGAILGMTRAEIARKFEEIVDFSEVERFLDTPVKRYSSGMYVRLAFAVAAHLEPEILIVDEVLAVGDAEFQKKCLGKMQKVSQGGRTVLFVSHQMAAVQNLCQTGILLSQGEIIKVGPMSDVVKLYLTQSQSTAELAFHDRVDRQGSGVLRFTRIALRDGSGERVNALTCGSSAIFELMVATTATHKLRRVEISIGIDNDLGQRILVFSTDYSKQVLSELPIGVASVELLVPRLTLAPGRYGYTVFASVNGETADWIKNAGTFDVEAADFYGTGRMPPSDQGYMVMPHEFRLGAY